MVPGAQVGPLVREHSGQLRASQQLDRAAGQNHGVCATGQAVGGWLRLVENHRAKLGCPLTAQREQAALTAALGATGPDNVE